jgi:hypothetical protein
MHRLQFVTRRQGEENDPTCIQEKIRKKRVRCFGAAFQACLAKDLACSGRRNRGQLINTSIKSIHFLLLTHGYIENGRRGIELLFMQDRALGHAAQSTQANIRTHGIRIFFALLSPLF